MTGLRSKDELIADLAEMISHGIRISPQLQSWLKEELEKA